MTMQQKREAARNTQIDDSLIQSATGGAGADSTWITLKHKDGSVEHWFSTERGLKSAQRYFGPDVEVTKGR